MPKIIRYQMEQFYFHYPCSATIVTSHAGGRSNAMAVAWHSAVSHDPPCYVISISPKRFTHQLLVESGEFVVNFMPWEKRLLVGSVASCSGKDVDKFSAFGIQASTGARVQVPVLADAVAAYECRVRERHPHGDHDLFVGEIVATHYEPAAFDTGFQLALDSNRPLLYLGDDRYTTGGQGVYLDRRTLVPPALRR